MGLEQVFEASWTLQKLRRAPMGALLSLDSGLGKIRGQWDALPQRIDSYRSLELRDEQVHDLVVRAVDSGICPVTFVPKILEKWREPEHEEFQGRNLWSAFNAFTEALKGNLNTPMALG